MNEKNRILIKLSGELLFAEDLDQLAKIIRIIDRLKQRNKEIAIVVGGGNIIRGSEQRLLNQFVKKSDADSMGMLATVINGIAIKSLLEINNIETALYSAITVKPFCKLYNPDATDKDLKQKKIVILTAGTGNRLLTTDTAAVIRAVENKCSVLLKVTKVDGVYDSDPLKHKDAKRFDNITYDEVLQKNLNVMDRTAICLASEHKMPIKILTSKPLKNIFDVAMGKGVYTLITENIPDAKGKQTT